MNKKQLIIIILFVFSLISGVLFQWEEFGVDDAFITYRFAEHIAEGKGFVWNNYEKPLYGSTSFFYTFLLSFFAKAGFDIPESSIVTGIISRALSSVLLFLICLLFTDIKTSVSASLLFSFSLSTIIFSPGLETQLYTTFILLTFYLYFTKRLIFTSIAAALLVMTRIDGLIVPFVITAHFLLKEKRLPFREILVFLVTLSPWLLYSLINFGSILPQTFYAKTAHESAVSGKFNIFHFIPELSKTTGGMLNLSFLCVLAITGMFSFIKKTPDKSVLTVWAISYYFAYTLFGLPHFTWYYTPLLFLFFIYISQGISFFTGIKIRYAKHIMVLAAALSVCLLFFQDYKWVKYRVLYGETSYKNNIRFQIAGVINNINKKPDATVLAYETGIIGYYTDLKVIDMLGLVTPEIIPHLKQKDYLWSFSHFNPDYVTLIDAPTSPATLGLFDLLKKNKSYNELAKIRTSFGHYYLLYGKENALINQTR